MVAHETASDTPTASDAQTGVSALAAGANADVRVVDTTSLQALAHPLRVRIWEMLSAYGPATASRLGKRLGESSGATSYHLRILARHGIVVEQAQLGPRRPLS